MSWLRERWDDICDWFRWRRTRHQYDGISTDDLLKQAMSSLENLPASREVHAAHSHLYDALTRTAEKKGQP